MPAEAHSKGEHEVSWQYWQMLGSSLNGRTFLVTPVLLELRYHFCHFFGSESGFVLALCPDVVAAWCELLPCILGQFLNASLEQYRGPIKLIKNIQNALNYDMVLRNFDVDFSFSFSQMEAYWNVARQCPPPVVSN